MQGRLAFNLLPGGWHLASSCDPDALRIVDGLMEFASYGPHYSRRTPGAKTFTGCGREIVLLHESGMAVWACIYQRTPARPGSGSSRGRSGLTDESAGRRWVWRNMLFRRLPGCPVLASELVRTATETTYIAWRQKYGSLPQERLRTEIGIHQIKSTNPGYCYKLAGYEVDRKVRDKLYLFAPRPPCDF